MKVGVVGLFWVEVAADFGRRRSENGVGDERWRGRRYDRGR